MVRRLALCFASLALAACGAKTGIRLAPLDAAPVDARVDATVRDAGTDLPPSDLGVDLPARDLGPDLPDFDAGCVPMPDGCGRREVCGNGADDDCNGFPDDGCACEPGRVQRCFAGPPGRRGVGICTDGMQTCASARTWGACTGGIVPTPDVCNGADNLCDGCSARRDCPIACPSPGDPRVPDGMPFVAYALRGPDFYPGLAGAWSWRVSGGPCDGLAPSLVSYTLDGATAPVATLTPRLSGDYTIMLTVTTVEGTVLTCSWVVHVRGPGLRVEMCYPESTSQDLDLYLQRTSTMSPWFVGFRPNAFNPTGDSCGWHDCEATIRGSTGRAGWGYMPSALSACDSGPHGPEWTALGFCANPRLDVDNNLSEGSGLPENINLDVPREGDAFRIMVENFTGLPAHPVVNVYCGGARVATFGAAPDTVPGFAGPDGNTSVGAMWRVAAVVVHTDASGATTGCDVSELHPPGATTGYDVTVDDPSY